MLVPRQRASKKCLVTPNLLHLVIRVLPVTKALAIVLIKVLKARMLLQVVAPPNPTQIVRAIIQLAIDQLLKLVLS